MKKILAFAGSNHAMSINHQLIEFTASITTNMEVTVLDIRDWDVPMYSLDIDDESPARISELIQLIDEYDGFMISSPEHNGGTPAFLKNILDWLSRKKKGVFERKPIFLLSTSPGPGGGATNLKYLIHSLPYQGATIGASYSLPSFHSNYIDGQVIGDHLGELKESIGEFKKSLN